MQPSEQHNHTGQGHRREMQWNDYAGVEMAGTRVLAAGNPKCLLPKHSQWVFSLSLSPEEIVFLGTRKNYSPFSMSKFLLILNSIFQQDFTDCLWYWIRKTVDQKRFSQKPCLFSGSVLKLTQSEIILFL